MGEALGSTRVRRVFCQPLLADMRDGGERRPAVVSPNPSCAFSSANSRPDPRGSSLRLDSLPPFLLICFSWLWQTIIGGKISEKRNTENGRRIKRELQSRRNHA